MNNPVYVGIENEILAYYRNGEYVRFDESYWNQLLQRYPHNFFKKSETAIRTKSGSAIYLDGDPEVNTHPVRVEPGFAQKAADSLYLARKELVDFVSSDDLRLIGYSMHWNISDVVGQATVHEIMETLAVPYSLFVLNPLSCGINIRRKDEYSGARIELLGDHIEDEDQIRAFLLFYAASIINFNANAWDMPMKISNILSNASCYPNLVQDGRYSKIEVDILRPSHRITITAQDYLEIYFEFFREGIEQLGTPDEVKNLEDFVYGRKKLEVDQFKRFAYASLFKERNIRSFEYNSRFCIDPNRYSEDREIPTPMGKFLGSLADKTNMFVREDVRQFSVSSMDWGYITIDEVECLGRPTSQNFSITKLENIDLIAEVLSELREKYGGIKNDLFTILVRDTAKYDSAYIPKSKNAWKKTNDTNINKHLKRAVLRAFERMYHKDIGNIAVIDFDVERRLGELEKRGLEYKPEEDQLPENYGNLFTELNIALDFPRDYQPPELPEEFEFSLWRAIKESNPNVNLRDSALRVGVGFTAAWFIMMIAVGIKEYINVTDECNNIEIPEPMSSYEFIADNVIDCIIEAQPSQPSIEESFEFIPDNESFDVFIP